MTSKTVKDLRSFLEKHPEAVVIDTRLASDFECEHIPGSKNNCVYEVAFVDRLTDVAPDKTVPVCLYGAAVDSLESKMAAGKLERKGYSSVYDFHGGLKAWRAEGFPVEGNGEAEEQRPNNSFDGERPVDTEASLIEWTGRNLASKHWGTLKIKSGSILFQGGQLIGGRIVIDMHSIMDVNIENSGLRKVLEDHLKSDDFFDVERFPEARVELNRTERIDEATVSTPNFKVSGILMLKGITHDIEFNTTSGMDAQGKWVTQAHFDFDRTRWNVIYGSGKYFRNLGMHVVNDLISLELKIVA